MTSRASSSGFFLTPLVICKLESALADEELSGLAENPRVAKDVRCKTKNLVREGAIDQGGEDIVLKLDHAEAESEDVHLV